MPIQATVADFMTSPVVLVDETLSLADARDRMHVNNIRHLCVVRDEAGRRIVIGVITQRDLVVAGTVSAAEFKRKTVADAMRKDPYTCSPETPLERVAYEMEQHRYGCAVVLDDDFPVGMFTTTDALRAIRQFMTGQVAERAPAAMPRTKGSENGDTTHALMSEKVPPPSFGFNKF